MLLGEVLRFPRVGGEVVELADRFVAEFGAGGRALARSLAGGDEFPAPLADRQPAGVLNDVVAALVIGTQQRGGGIPAVGERRIRAGSSNSS